MTIRNAPRATPAATPTATATRKPGALTDPPEISSALSETAISAGSATVVAKPMAAAKR